MKTKERLRRIEKAILFLQKEHAQTNGPGRVECPRCGTVKNLGNIVLNGSDTFMICKCNETIKISVTIVKDKE